LVSDQHPPSVSIGQLTSTTGTSRFGQSDDGGGSEGKTEIEVGTITTLAYGNGTVELLAALKAFQSENLGELISSPNINVRSGETGRIQVGQDFSIKQKDFAATPPKNSFPPYHHRGHSRSARAGFPGVRAPENHRRAQHRATRSHHHHRE
jgi:hypothetical protein